MPSSPLTDAAHHTQYWVDDELQEHRLDGPASVGLSSLIEGHLAMINFGSPPFAICHWSNHGVRQRLVGRSLGNDLPKMLVRTGFIWNIIGIIRPTRGTLGEPRG